MDEWRRCFESVWSFERALLLIWDHGQRAINMNEGIGCDKTVYTKCINVSQDYKHEEILEWERW